MKAMEELTSRLKLQRIHYKKEWTQMLRVCTGDATLKEPL